MHVVIFFANEDNFFTKVGPEMVSSILEELQRKISER